MKTLIAALLVTLSAATMAFPAQNKNAKSASKPAAAPVDDAAITTSVKDKLSKTPSLKDANINVDTKAGKVTLTGSLKTAGLKGVATNVAKSVKGVKSVDNQITVEGPAPADDAAITKSVQAKLAATPSLKNANINVATSGGVVTLSGTVKAKGLKGLAAQQAMRVKGVKSVNNQLTVEGGPTAGTGNSNKKR
jgi:hyperosmotically inducible periplasmic protein